MRNNVCARKMKLQTQNIMKQFNLEEYLANPKKKVVTRDGRSARIICTNFTRAHNIIAEIEGNDFSASYHKDGIFTHEEESNCDLFFAPEKHEGWTPVYHERSGKIRFGYAYSTKKEAEEASKYDIRYITTAKVEWEE